MSGRDHGRPGSQAGLAHPEAAGAPTPAFLVRESGRAKHVRLVMTPREGLVVVVPRGFDQDKIPGILERRKAWIERASDRVGTKPAAVPTGNDAELPQEIDLRCLGARWTVEYALEQGAAPAGTRTVARERSGRRIVVYGVEGDTAALLAAIRRWLVRKARTTLVPRLAVLACEHGFALGPVSVRRQRTRWASCSHRGAVSLNVKLLFLPPELVDYVLLHELCHTVRPDHSPLFWALLAQRDRDYGVKRRRIREAHRFVPEWFEGQRS